MHERDDTFQGYGPIICLKSAILDFPSISLSNKPIIVRLRIVPLHSIKPCMKAKAVAINHLI